MASKSGQIYLLPAKTITTALTAFVGQTFQFGVGFPKVMTLWAEFVYGSAGTTAKAWVQTSFDDGTSWMDVANFAFTTATLEKAAQLNNFVAAATVVTPTDGTLADNTTVNGFLSNLWRVKLTTTGTYAGNTSLSIFGLLR